MMMLGFLGGGTFVPSVKSYKGNSKKNFFVPSPLVHSVDYIALIGIVKW